MGFERKIVNTAELLRRVQEARSLGRTIVQCHGCFDIVHPGHVRYLEFARRQGDLLIVSLTGDEQVGKGHDRPYIPQELRAENIAALEVVDLVVIHPEPTAESLLSRVRPDVYVKGAEYEHSRDVRFLAERRVVEGSGGRIIFSSGDVVFSSTRLISRMHDAGVDPDSRLELTCSRYGIDQAALLRLCEGFRGERVMVIGDLILDRYVHCDTVGIASESPVMSLAQLGEQTFVGGAGIIARHVAALGARAVLVSRAGDDAASEEARRTLKEEGIDAHLSDLQTPLPQKTRFLAEDAKLFKLDQVRHQPLDSRAEDEVSAVIEGAAPGMDAVILCDFGCGLITGGLLERIMPALRRHARVLSADVSGKRANLLHFRHADLLCPTEREVRAALNDHESGLSNAAWQLLQQTQARHAIITLGKRGLVTFERPGKSPQSPQWNGRLISEALPTFAPYATDCLGAGDAMLATATLALAGGANLLQASYLGNAAAAMEVLAPGNVPIAHAALCRWIRGRRELAVASRQSLRQDVAAPAVLEAAPLAPSRA